MLGHVSFQRELRAFYSWNLNYSLDVQSVLRQASLIVSENIRHNLRFPIHHISSITTFLTINYVNRSSLPGKQDLGRVGQGEGVGIRITRSCSPWILAHLAVDKNWLAYALQYRRHQGQVFEEGIICTRYHAARSVQDVVLESPFLGDGWTGDRATGWITVFQFAPDTLISLDTTAPLIKIIPFLA